MITSRVRGREGLREMEARLAVADKDFEDNVAEALREVAPKLPGPVREAAAAMMPHRGGYAAVLEEALEFDIHVRRKSLSMTVWAAGQKKRRDVPALNRGVLRHPVFGRRTDAWKTTRIPRGFVDKGFDRDTELVTDAVKKARDKTAREVVR